MPVNEYYEFIKGNKAKLRQFIADMPKGAELHHHLTGAAYAETLFSIACDANLYVNLQSGRLYEAKPPEIDSVRLSNGMDNYHQIHMTLIDKWSVKNYQPYKYPLGPDEYFFSLFGNFIAAAGNKYLGHIVHQLKVRAKEENLQYIETIGIAPSVPTDAFLSNKYDEFTEKLKEWSLASELPEEKVRNLIKKVIGLYNNQYCDTGSKLYKTVQDYISDNVSILNPSNKTLVKSKFDAMTVPENEVLMKLQGYASRDKAPLIVLCQLYIIFKAMQLKPDVIVGCNLVAAENSENSMQYYLVHMLMFSELGAKFENDCKKTPNIALHAGELTMGLVPPEHLTYHVTYAVLWGRARRVGHGVDIVFEHDSAYLLHLMKENDIAIEINLTSNEFILGVKGDSHPFSIYKDSGVPMVISTDDPGILRTSITEEYALAAYRYALKYEDIKNIARNSIKYSFLNEDDKNRISAVYEKKLAEFEDKYADFNPPKK